MQLIFCVETNKKADSDYIYIKKTIEHFYQYDKTTIKLSAVYMDGRGNYRSRRVENRVAKLIKDYKVGSGNDSVVIYCFDCDNFDSNPEDKKFLKEAEQFCKEKGFKFVWFCREIESVYLGRQIEDKLKAKLAEDFARKDCIKQVRISNLKATGFRDKCSNFGLILDELLDSDL